MFGKLRKNRLADKKNDDSIDDDDDKSNDDNDEQQQLTCAADDVPQQFVFDNDDDNYYVYPSLFEEADEMLQVSLLIYSMTDLRTLAKNKNTTANLTNPERILSLPLNLASCLEMIQDNIDVINSEMGDSTDHDMTISALQSIQDRCEGQALSSSGHWLSPFVSVGGGQEVNVGPSLVAYGDDKPDSDLVYAIGVDPIRKRVTVAFRGSVTPSDFMTDANITLNRRPNPTTNSDGDGGGDDDADTATIGIHHGFYEYLLKPRKGSGESKYTEIMSQLEVLFQDSETRAKYRLYVTGHSLGGALATLFAFYVAAAAATTTTDDNGIIPKPVTCVSVASPRVGEGQFQAAFRLLERRGWLRHLRIVNDRDPVTTMPTSSSKKLWAMLSPASYIAFKLSDQDFAAKETYQHTGIKLKLRKPGESFEIAYSSTPKTSKEQDLEQAAAADVDKQPSGRRLSFKQKDLPGVVYHLGNTYSKNLAGAKDMLMGMSLNELYQSKAASLFSNG